MSRKRRKLSMPSIYSSWQFSKHVQTISPFMQKGMLLGIVVEALGFVYARRIKRNSVIPFADENWEKIGFLQGKHSISPPAMQLGILKAY